MAWDAKSTLIGSVIGVAIGFTSGFAYRYYDTYIEPWDDGLIHVDCPRVGKPNFEATIRGIGIMDDSDNHAFNPPVATINFPYDPKAWKSPNDLQFKMDRHQFPLGCFATGIQQKDIVRRPWR